MSKLSVKYNENTIKRIDNVVNMALFEAGDRILTDLKISGTMPFDVGTLQNNQTSVVKGNKKVSIVTAAKWAKRLYFHPDFNFQKTNNAKAGAYWFEPYISGQKKRMAKNEFLKALRRGL